MNLEHARNISASLVLLTYFSSGVSAELPIFSAIQNDLFSDPVGQSNAWGD